VRAGLDEVRRASFSLVYVLERDGVTVLEGRTRHAALEVGTHRPVRVPAWLADAVVAPS
jgi:acyl-CoA thioesterase FadM